MFECDGEVNMTEGFDCCYTPEKYWNDNNYTLAYCETCYRERCKNHANFEKGDELKLDNYWKKTDNGRLISKNSHL